MNFKETVSYKLRYRQLSMYELDRNICINIQEFLDNWCSVFSRKLYSFCDLLSYHAHGMKQHLRKNSPDAVVKRCGSVHASSCRSKEPVSSLISCRIGSVSVWPGLSFWTSCCCNWACTCANCFIISCIMISCCFLCSSRIRPNWSSMVKRLSHVKCLYV